MTNTSRDYFDEVAGRWDQMREEFFPTAIRDRAMDMAAVCSGETAADIGAGTGFVTEGLVERGLNVVAVDQSERMLAILNERLSHRGNVECRVGTSENLPIGDNGVDHVFANMYLHHVEDPAVAITEMVRVVKQGGTVVLTDLDSHAHEFLKTEQRDRWMGFEREQVRQWFEDAGLVDVRLECAGSDCCTVSNLGHNVAISIFVAHGKRPAPGYEIV